MGTSGLFLDRNESDTTIGDILERLGRMIEMGQPVAKGAKHLKVN
jgi:hypothetical protein